MVKEESRGWSRVTNLVVVQNFFPNSFQINTDLEPRCNREEGQSIGMSKIELEKTSSIENGKVWFAVRIVVELKAPWFEREVIS